MAVDVAATAVTAAFVHAAVFVLDEFIRLEMDVQFEQKRMVKSKKKTLKRYEK